MTLELSAPEHVTADFLGEPGERTFYIQAIENGEQVTVLVEKEQVAGLAEVLTKVLAEIDAEPASVWDVEAMRLREPVAPRWRGGSVAVGLDSQLGRLVIEITELVGEGETREAEQVRIWLSEEQARRLAGHAAWAVEQGRPTCRLCGLPMDRDGHLCPRSDGDAREL